MVVSREFEDFMEKSTAENREKGKLFEKNLRHRLHIELRGRPIKEVSLPGIHPQLVEDIQFTPCFDPFRNRNNIILFAERDNEFNDAPFKRIRIKIADNVA